MLFSNVTKRIFTRIGNSSHKSPKQRNVVVVLGAGATVACGGPTTNDILPMALRHFPKNPADIGQENWWQFNIFSPEDHERAVQHWQTGRALRTEVEAFLISNYDFARKPGENPEYSAAEFRRPLTTLLGDVDAHLGTPAGLNEQWPVPRLALVRQGFEYLIFVALEHALKQAQGIEHHIRLFRAMQKQAVGLSVISLNYDVIADNSLIYVYGEFPDYACKIMTPEYNNPPDTFGKARTIPMLKLHGSLNWTHCPSPKCQRLNVGIARNSDNFIKMQRDIYQRLTFDSGCVCEGRRCENCGTPIRPVLVSPKAHSRPEGHHMVEIWSHAARVLKQADEVHFIGYSLPEEDDDIRDLLGRNLAALPRRRITVVTLAQARARRNDPVYRRFREVLGGGFAWRGDGFAGYAESLASAAGVSR